MKRVKSACILQTLIFKQKEEYGFSHERALELTREEVKLYKMNLDRNKTRYVIDEETELEDGSIIVKVRKQYNDKIDIGEYFN